MKDWPRILGGKRKTRKSAPLSMSDSPGKALLIKNGHYYGRKAPKNSLTGRGTKVDKTFCARRYNDFMGLLSAFDYCSPPALIQPQPRIIFEVEGLASFTDSKEALLSSLSIGKKVQVYHV